MTTYMTEPFYVWHDGLGINIVAPDHTPHRGQGVSIPVEVFDEIVMMRHAQIGANFGIATFVNGGDIRDAQEAFKAYGRGVAERHEHSTGADELRRMFGLSTTL